MEFYYMKSGAETSKPNLMKSCTYEGRVKNQAHC